MLNALQVADDFTTVSTPTDLRTLAVTAEIAALGVDVGVTEAAIHA